MIFLPPNTTSVLQPVNEGVIRSLKAHYRRRIVLLCIKALDHPPGDEEFSVIIECSVRGCKKANISHANQQTAVTDADDPFKTLEEELDNLRKLDQSAVQDNASAESVIGLDCEVVTSASYMSDANIFTEVIPVSIEDRMIMSLMI